MFPGPLLSDPKTLIFYRVAQIQWEGKSLCPRNISYSFTIILAVALFSLLTHAFWWQEHCWLSLLQAELGSSLVAFDSLGHEPQGWTVKVEGKTALPPPDSALKLQNQESGQRWATTMTLNKLKIWRHILLPRILTGKLQAPHILQSTHVPDIVSVLLGLLGWFGFCPNNLCSPMHCLQTLSTSLLDCLYLIRSLIKIRTLSPKLVASHFCAKSPRHIVIPTPPNSLGLTLWRYFRRQRQWCPAHSNCLSWNVGQTEKVGDKM